MASSSSASSCNWVYDVFPSFSGEDVRVTFLSHLLKELDRKLIIAFKDNEIQRSHSLDPVLKQAIRNSRIAVVVFSEKYPSSSWCLNELVEIVKCKEKSGQLIIPIFYGLDPSHVRKQTGKFGEAFAKTCQKKTKEETRLWGQSLTQVANMLGYHSQNWPNEAKMIEAIANDVLNKLNLTPPKDFEDFVGMEGHIAKMNVLLHLESEEVRMVGIWGSSGIGKTSIARALYSQLSHRFQGSVFIDKAFVSNSVKIYKNANPHDYNMKLHLLRSFLSEILDKNDIRISCLGVVKERLKHQKVLICIDDLDQQMVLDTLVGQTQWFGRGSRIIVITNDRQFLRAHRIEHIYEVCLPSANLALKMFCRFAFRQLFPPDGLMDFASQVALCAGNLPLGLHVLGSYVRGIETEDLMEMLPRLRNDLDGDIERTLRVSYDGLKSPKDKAIFRYIACLFSGERVSVIKQLLAESGLNVNFGLKNLVDKSLICIRDDIVVMHSLLQKLGKEIVRAQSNQPGEREFIMDSMDVCDVLENNTGTNKVLGIALDMDEIDELHIHESAFKRMRNLLSLEIYTNGKEVIWHLRGGLDYLPKTLRLLRLDGYPKGYMPSNFCPENLVKLKMQGSKLERLWEGVQTLRGLKEIDLSKSMYLKEIPDLSMATNLEKLDLWYCPCLVELPSSIQHLNKLEELNMSRCRSLETLPNGINLQSLDTLYLGSCSRLNSFPNISTNVSTLILSQEGIDECPSSLILENLGMNTMQPYSLKSLYLSNIPSLVELPSSIENFIELEELNIVDCINLKILPTGINMCSLTYLNFKGCSRLKTFPNISTNIEILSLNGTVIEEVPWWIENFTKLTHIIMKGCNNLLRVSLNIYKLKLLTEADFSDCGALTEANWNGIQSAGAMATETIQKNSLYVGLYHPQFTFKFLNLDPQALLQNRSITFKGMILSGEEVPSYFTHTTTGYSLINIPLLPTALSQQYFIFRVCVVFDCDSMPVNRPIVIHVNSHFKDRFGNSFDFVGQPHVFRSSRESQLYILECLIPLKKYNAPLAQQIYDHVDMQIHIQEAFLRYLTTFKLKGWGIRLLEECSWLENRLGNPNTFPLVCEADVDNVVNETEDSEECVEEVVKRQRETGGADHVERPFKKHQDK